MSIFYFLLVFLVFDEEYTPGTAGGPGGRDRTLAVKSRQTDEKSSFFLKKIKFTPQFFFCIYLLVMPKYKGGKLFHTWEFPRSGSKAKDGEKKEKKSESW